MPGRICRQEGRPTRFVALVNGLSINQLQLVIDQDPVMLDHDTIEHVAEEESIFCVTKPLDKEEDLYKGFRNAISARVRFPLFRKRATKTPSDFLEYRSSVEFLEYLYDETSVRVRSKHQNELISTSNFADREGVTTKIGRENVTYTFGFWFDCDGDSDLDPEEFASWFPHLEMVFYATSKSTKSNLRWRAYFPTSMGMNVQVFELIKDQLVEIINQHGYWSAKELAKNARLPGRLRHGFDKGVWRPETKIYLPAVPADPTGAYRAIYVGEDRAPIDIMAWIDSQIDTILERQENAQHEAETVRETIQAATFTPVESGVSPKLQEMRWQLQGASRASTQGSGRDAAIERATDAWRGTPKGQGHAEFWRYACHLRTIGLDDAELEQQLRLEAHSSYTSGSERAAEIPNIVRSLARRGRL